MKAFFAKHESVTSAIMRATVVSLSLLGVTTCSTKPDGTPGQCKLSCGSAIIAPSDYVVKKLSSDINIRCSAPGQKADVLTRFGIFKKQVVGDAAERTVPVPNISVLPVVVGFVDESVQAAGVPGVTTSEDELCSDACGSVTLKVRIICPAKESSEVAIGINSGALSAVDQAVLVKISAPEATVDTTDGNDN